MIGYLDGVDYYLPSEAACKVDALLVNSKSIMAVMAVTQQA